MIYYNSNQLSERLGIGLSKWKRWAREFLAPDPLGGLQSGFARQFSLKDAFHVYLAGCLVADLKFSIPETRQILSDLNSWLKKTGFSQLHISRDTASKSDSPFFRIYIIATSSNRFAYTIRAVERPEALDPPMAGRQRESYTFAFVSAADDSDPIACDKVETARVLGISTIYRNFLEKLKA